MNKTLLLIIRALLTLAFGAAGLAKLAGAEMMVQTFDAVGFGQWLRYVTGAIEVGSAIALWIPGLQAYAAGLLVCTMIGALIAHALVLGLSTAQLFDPVRPVVWTEAALSRRIELFDPEGFYQ